MVYDYSCLLNLIIAKLKEHFPLLYTQMTTTQPLSQSKGPILWREIKWQTYQALLTDLAEETHQRLTYDSGTLEIMTPRPLG